MTQLDAITDAINKLLDKAQQVAPTVWAAALHQVAINARMSFLWGVGWLIVGGIAVLIGWGIIPGLYVADRRKYSKALEIAKAQYTLDAARHEEETTGKVSKGVMRPNHNYGISEYDYRRKLGADDNPNENLPIVGTFAGITLLIVVFCAILAFYSFWNAWQMSQNPTWWAIQLLKG